MLSSQQTKNIELQFGLEEEYFFPCFPMEKAIPLRIPENSEQILSLHHPIQVYCCRLHNYELQKEKKKYKEG